MTESLAKSRSVFLQFCFESSGSVLSVEFSANYRHAQDLARGTTKSLRLGIDNAPISFYWSHCLHVAMAGCGCIISRFLNRISPIRARIKALQSVTYTMLLYLCHKRLRDVWFRRSLSVAYSHKNTKDQH